MTFLSAKSSTRYNDVSSGAEDTLCSRDVRESQTFSQTGETTILEVIPTLKTIPCLFSRLSSG